jgi:hypothetical protein
MSSVRIKKITVEPNESLTIQDGTVIIKDTSESTSMLNGALNIHGGLGIYCSYDSVSSTSGGALTIGGGLAVNKTTYLGGDVLLDNTSKTFSINGVATERLFMDTILNKNFYISPDGNSKRFDLYDTQLLINITTPSTSVSSGALVISGGISIASTENSLKVAGDSVFYGDVVHDKDLIMNYNNKINLKSAGDALASIYMQNEDLYLSNDADIRISATSTIIQDNLNITGDLSQFGQRVVILDTLGSSNASTGSLVVKGGISIMCSVDASSDTCGGALTVDGGMAITRNLFVGDSIDINVNVAQPRKVVLYDDLSNFTGLGSAESGSMLFSTTYDYIFRNNSSNNDSFKIKGTNEIVFMNKENTQDYSFLVTDGSLNVTTNDVQTFSVDFIGNTNGTSVNVANKLGDKLTLTENLLYASSDLILQNQLTLGTDGSSTFSGDTSLLKRVSINSTEDALSNTFGGALTINGGMSVSKNVFMGSLLTIDNVELLSTDGSLIVNSSLVIQNTSATLLSINGTTDGLNVLNSGSDIIIASSVGSLHLNDTLFLQTGGNIGINTTNPNYTFDINGKMNVGDYSYINGLEIVSENDAIDINSRGSLYVQGGATIDKNLIVNGVVSFTDTTESSNTGGAVNISGGLTISSGQAGAEGSGALTVNGGGYFGGSVYVQQNLTVSGVINGAASSTTFAYVSLTATDEALNLSSGSLVTFGGITTQCYTNAVNTSNGGSFLTPGGASIGKDLYVGGDMYQYGKTNMHGTTNALVDIYDIYNTVKFSIDRNVASNNLSITRYDSLGNSIEKTIDISSLNGNTTFNCTVPSSSINTASVILHGGLSISATQDANNLGNGGALSVYGGASINGRAFIGGDTVFSSTTTSTNCSNGSVVVLGGMGVVGSLNVFGNTIFSGNVSIMGTTTSIHSTEVILDDNFLLLNAGPSGSFDSGIFIQRYQTENNDSIGDVVADNPYNEDTIPLQSGLTKMQIKLSSSASNQDDYYIGWWIEVNSGFGANQVRKIVGYTGSSRIATILSEWTTSPANGDHVSLYNKPYVGMIYNEIHDRFEFGSNVKEMGIKNVSLTDTLPIYFSQATSTSTQPSASCTSGGIITHGGFASNCTTDATSMTSGGCLTLAGGASIAKTMYVGETLYINGVNVTPNQKDVSSSVSFSVLNNTTESDITGLLFDNTVWGFDIYVAVQIKATSNYYSNYHIRGVNKSSEWELIMSYVGDQTVTFNITNSGQVQYSTLNFDGFTSGTIKYKVVTN